MKTTTVVHLKASKRMAVFACDVSKDRINLYSDLGTAVIEDEFLNQTRAVEHALAGFEQIAVKHGFGKIKIVCEPTGVYHRLLINAAERLGYDTAWVNPEAVAKMRVIESNDDSKTDIKDPRVIHTLASIGKTLKHREFKGIYLQLREWNLIYESADCGAVSAKCAIHPRLRALFPDYNFGKDFLYSPSGRALMTIYGCNPYKIIKAGMVSFENTMKADVPRIRKETLKRLFDQAQSSVKNALEPGYSELLEVRLRQLFEEYDLHQKRKIHAREHMEAIYDELRLSDSRLPGPVQKVISQFHLARIIAETGPFSDFSNWRKMLRFSGQNIRERQSGQYRGKSKMSKKGRPLIRKILFHAVLPLVKKNGIYGKYYHNKIASEKVSGTMAMAAVSRKFLKMLFGLYKSGRKFDPDRVFVCESEYEPKAAA